MRLDIPEKKYEEFKQITTELFSSTIKKDNPLHYTCNRDIYDQNLFVWNEEWESYIALQKHLNAPHFKKWYSYAKKYQVGDLNVIYAPTSEFDTLGNEKGV